MHLFLSPHFDDAAYSCGATIYRLASQGVRVAVLTIMAGGVPKPLPDTPLLRELHKRWQVDGCQAVKVRLREDKRALKHLKAQALYFDLPDCVYRVVDGHPLYPTEAHLWGEIHPHDYAPRLLTQSTQLTSELIGHRVEVIYAPLAVGRHVDHRIVRDWARMLSRIRTEWRLKFYTDFPYMRDETAIHRALDDVDEALCHEDACFTTLDLEARLKAMAEYKSQVSTFWEDEEAMAEDTRRAFSRLSGDYAERFWIREVSQ
ncbi:MAG: PIG-L family deacetylase [Anaerolineae bacterium]|nr:PIG-L family deacetylase [Anaerolineae bacterium]MDW8174017.1 PIG-L family deacetylase [Anaerolineae bacterium]